MSTPLLVLVVEIIIVLLGLVFLLLFFRWKTKKAKTSALEQLLDNIASLENTRQQLLFEHLQKGYALEDDEAITLSVLLVNAEKQFMQVFIQQQIEQTTVTGFYQTLCELLDQYLNTIPTLNSPDLNLTASVAAADHVENPTEEESQEKPDNSNESDTTEEAEPDWEDAFSESGDEMDEASKEAIENETSTDAEIINEEDEEPNWDEAFSESGDEMDEASKKAVENETATDAEIINEQEDGEPNWDEAFSESGDEMDETTKQGMQAEQKQDN